VEKEKKFILELKNFAKMKEIDLMLVSIIEEFMPKSQRGKHGKTIGWVKRVGDGIAYSTGLSSVMAGELVHFPRAKMYGLALNLELDSAGIVLFGRDWLILEGDAVQTTGSVMSVSVGDFLLGSVLDALGQPFLGSLPVTLVKKRVEAKAPGIISRKSVHEPVQTGIKAN